MATTSGRLCSKTKDLDLVGLHNFLQNMVVPFRSHLDTKLFTQIPVNPLGQLVKSFFVLWLYITFADNMKYSPLCPNIQPTLKRDVCFHYQWLYFLTDWSCAALMKPSVTFFSPPPLNQSQDLLFATFSVHLKYWPRSGLFIQPGCHSSFFSLLYSFDPTSSALVYVCATFNKLFTVLLTWQCKLLHSMLTLSTTLSNPLPPKVGG